MFDESTTRQNLESFFKVQNKNETDVHNWLKGMKDQLLDENSTRTAVQRKFLRAFMGVDSTDTVVRRDPRDPSTKKKRIRKFRIPHIHDIVETRVSQMTRLQPKVEVMPANQEFSDRGAAKVAKAMIDYIFLQQALDDRMIDIHRNTSILGEAFLFINYNQEIGDYKAEYVAAQEAGIEYPKNLPKRMGDVEYELEYPWRVLLQVTDKFEKCEYYFRYKIIPTDEVIENYPEKAEKLGKKHNQGVTIFDINNLEPRLVENHTVVWEFWHKRTEFVEDGYFAKFTDDCMLETGPYPFTMDEFNFERLTDVDLPGDNRGVSKFEFALPMQRLYDDLTTLIGKNIYMTAHTKMAVPKGSVKIDALGNDNTIVQYTGPQAPTTMNVQPNAPEVYSFRENIKNEMQTIMGSHGISRGEIPKGITAASALTFLNELESERQSSGIAKHANFIKGVARKTMAIAADFYEADEERMVRIVGKNKAPLLKHFDAAVFSRPYDITFESSSGFPETKAAQMQRTQEAMQYNPTLMTPQEWQYALNIGGHEKMVSIATEAIQAAESEVEDILAGEEVYPPEFYQDHAPKLRVFYAAIQSRAFTEESDDEVYENLIQHISLQEQFALERAKTSASISAELATIKLFPITPELQPIAAEIVKSMEQRMAEAQGQANLTGQAQTSVPGEDKDNV